MIPAGVRELEQAVYTLYDTRDQLKRHVFDRSDEAFARGDAERDRIGSREQLEERRVAMKQALLDAFGGLPDRDAPLNARVTRIVKGSGYEVENIIFESRPGHYVTSNLYLPEHRATPAAAVLFLCGHEYEAKNSLYYHQVILRFVQAGLIVLAVDPIGQGERLNFADPQDGSLPKWGTADHQHFGARCYPLGDSIARYFVHDAMRAVDYLLTRKEVDPARIGVTGNSGGGTQTAMMMVCDERIAAAAPGTFIMNRQAYMHAGGVQDAEQVWPGLTAGGFDHEDLLLSFAPKPLMVLAAEYDFFPIEATRRTVARCRRFWEMLGKGNDFMLFEDRTQHRYTDRMAVKAAVFFARHFAAGLSEPSLEGEEPLRPLEPGQLQCTCRGQVMLSLPDARTVGHENAERAAQLRRQRQERPDERRSERALAWLREKVVTPRVPCPFNPRRVPLEPVDGLQVEHVLWWSQRGLMNSGYLFTDRAASGVTVAVWPGGTSRLSEHWTWIREACEGGRTVLVLNASGVGPHEPYPIYGKPARRLFGVLHKLTDELIWLGDSLAALRTYDVLRSLDLIGQLGDCPGEKIECYAAGFPSLYVQLAASLDDRIGSVTLADSLHSVSDWVQSQQDEEEEMMSIVFPGILRYLDLDELQGKGS